MDSKKSPPPRIHNLDSVPDSDLSSNTMAAVAQPLAPPPPAVPTVASAGVNKRYRPAPAKTFQCRGYGECRMVFSRSEHLARHIRKHTGERPFTCHCGKQFSRLDNLRQHAQTVHADKQDQNERMMHELTSLHARMTAASKGGQARGKRAQLPGPAPAPPSSTFNGSVPSMAIKQEDASLGIPPMNQRPGTSTGYEGANAMFHHGTSSWHVQTSDVDRPNMRPTNNHSFRDPGQSFRVPSTSASSPTTASSLYQQQLQHNPGQSFLVPSAVFKFSLSDISSATRPGSSGGPLSSSDPATATTATATAAGVPDTRSLPPLAAVVSSSLAPGLPLPPQPLGAFSVPAQQQQQQQQQPLTHSHVLPLPTPSGPYGIHGRRPSTATRPGTAPASFYYSSAAAPPFPPGPGGAVPALGPHRPELSLRLSLGHGRIGGGLEPIRRFGPAGGEDAGGDEPTSPSGGPYGDSPFSFHAPATTAAAYAAEPPALANPRKRPHSGSDDDGPREREREREWGDVRPLSGGGRGEPEYDYGSESRPQSRRLSVMELCNDADADAAAARPFVPLPGATAASAASASAAAAAAARSRPTTSSGLVTSAAQLALVDRPSVSPPPAGERAFGGAGAAVLAGAAASAAGAAATAAGAAVSGAGASPRAGSGACATAGGGLRGGEPGRTGVLSNIPGGGASPGGGRRVGGRVPSPLGDAGRSVSAGGRRGGSAGAGGSPGSGGEPCGNDKVRYTAAVGMRV